MKTITFISLVLTAIFLHACAVQKSPLGGKKDELPPVLDTLKSTPNYLTNFDLAKVVLKFDEFIELKNAFEQVVYSPPMRTKPEMVQRGKKLTLKFPKTDTLRPQTTYTINFGEAIVDLNEGNPISNFRYVFSTGDIIDSLAISGRVVNDMSKLAAEAVLVMLYDNLEDSIVYKEQPYYFAKTNEAGNFEIKNLRSDTFKVVILEDGNLNLKYDEGEAIGFLDSFIVVNDSFNTPLALNIFEPLLPAELIGDESKPFRMKFEFAGDPKEVEISSARDSSYWLREINNDSIILWHDNTILNDSFYVLGDTIVYRRRVSKAETPPIGYSKSNLKRGGILPVKKDITLEFPFAIQQIDESKFELSDSLVREIKSLTTDSLNPRKLLISYDFKYGDTLGLYIDPGGINMVHGGINDTISELIIPESPDKYGTIFLSVDSLDSSAQYLMQLLDGEEVVLEELVSDQKSASFTYRLMPPKTYSVKLSKDLNRNGRWDPGSYALKTQSEEWQLFELEELRENWELEAKVEWKE